MDTFDGNAQVAKVCSGRNCAGDSLAFARDIKVQLAPKDVAKGQSR